MAKPWREVAASKAYKDLPVEQQQAAQEQYFTDVVQPQAGDNAAAARVQFFSSYPTEKKGFLSSVGEAITGSDRMTEQQRALPEIGGRVGEFLPGLPAGKGMALSGAMLTTTDPDEIAKMVASSSPDVAVTYNLDAEGVPYPILTNRETGKVVQVNKPGLSGIDVMQGLGIAAAFTGAGKVPSMVSGGLAKQAAAGAAASGATSALLEGGQVTQGGEFSGSQVAIDTALGGIFEPAIALAKATGRPVLDAFKSLARRAGFGDDEIIRAGDELMASVGGVDSRVTPSVEQTQEGVKRMSRAADEGVPLSQSQASKDFASQEAEQTLLSSSSPEGELAREFERGQQAQLREMMERGAGGSSRLTQALGDEPATSVSQQNEAVRKALTDAKELSGQQVRGLYRQAEEIPGDAIPLNNDLILDAADEAIVSMPTEPAVKTAIEKALAKFGLIGDVKVDAEGVAVRRGRNRTLIEDDGQTIEILGDVTPLGLNNSEAFRKELNKAVGADTTGAAKQVVRALDGVVEDAASTISDPARKEAFESARKAAAQKAATFKAKDIVQQLTGFKPGTKTPQVSTQDVINNVVKGSKSFDNTKRVLDAMKKYPGAASGDAKKALGSEALGDIFSQAFNKDTLKVSGQRLNSAVKKYDPETLKLILGAEGVSRLKKIQAIVGDATIPLPRTGNPSGTAYKLMNMMEGSMNALGAGQVNLGTMLLVGVRKGKEIKNRKQTLKNLTDNVLLELSGEGQPANSKLKQAARILAILELREENTPEQ